MGWATAHIEKLIAGETVQFRAYGHSMAGRVESGSLCTVRPLGDEPVPVGSVVLCRVGNDHDVEMVARAFRQHCRVTKCKPIDQIEPIVLPEIGNA
jgi:hypothetical protein